TTLTRFTVSSSIASEVTSTPDCRAAASASRRACVACAYAARAASSASITVSLMRAILPPGESGGGEGLPAGVRREPVQRGRTLGGRELVAERRAPTALDQLAGQPGDVRDDVV